MSERRLGLAMLTRNGGARALRAIASVRPHLDELVVIDTGSTDDTRELIVRYSNADAERPLPLEYLSCTPALHPEAFLEDAPGTWADIHVPGVDLVTALAPYSTRSFLADFGLARRLGWPAHQAKYVTYLDSDDVWQDAHLLPELLAAMESARCDSAALPYDHRRDAEGRPAIEQITQRIVRHAHGKWYGRMHEHLDAIGQRGLFTQFGSVRDMDDLRDPGSRTHLRGLKALLRFWHDGDDGEQTLYSLGMEARAPLPELAVELLITVARMTEWTERRGKAYFEAGLVHEIQGRGPQAWECHTLAAAADPRNPDPVLGLARLAHYAKRHDECVALTERGLELARDARSVLQWNPQARGLWPAYVLAGSLRALGRLDEARARLLPHLRGAPPAVMKLAQELDLLLPGGSLAV